MQKVTKIQLKYYKTLKNNEMCVISDIMDKKLKEKI